VPKQSDRTATRTRAPAGPTTQPATSRIKAPKGATSNYYLHQLATRGDDLTADERKELALLIKHTHRIKPVAKGKQGKSVFDSVTGHHEWLPTDRALEIVNSTTVWQGLYTSLRSPTWLLVVNPERYCADSNAYRAGIEAAAGHAISKNGKTVAASSLGLVGHSGGLNHKGTQLTQHQSTWHDELRDLYDKHGPTNSYDAYWYDLQNFINATFLFVSGTTLPLGKADIKRGEQRQCAEVDSVGSGTEWSRQP
jgi:hypothetical protein